MSEEKKKKIDCIISIIEIQNLPTKEEQVKCAFETAKTLLLDEIKIKNLDKILGVIQSLALLFLAKKDELPSKE